jgi:pyruvate,water dikinase
MTQTKTTDFPVTWDNPGDANLTWAMDHMHSPGVATPLSFDLAARPFIEGFGMLRACYQNYYIFYARTAPPAGDARKVELDAIIQGGRLWREQILPEVQGFDAHYRSTDFDAMNNAELVDELDRLVEVRVRCGQLHTMCTMPWWTGMEHLISTFHELTGGDDLGAVRLVQGYGNKSVEAGRGLWRLSRMAAESLSMVGVISDRGKPGSARLEQLKAADAHPFLDEFAQFLDEFGWRTGAFEFAAPTWAEDPTVPLDLIAAYLDMPDYDPDAEQERLVREREAAINEATAGLDPKGAAQLRASVDAAAQVAPILEDHNYYIDQRVSTLPRRLVLAAGRRLVQIGELETADDVFYLRHEELRRALLGELKDAAAVAAAHKAGMEQWSKATPPETVGTPPSPSAGEEPPNRFWGGGNLRSDRPGELKGHAASAGVVRGSARVIATLEEGHRLKRGDVLITRATMPPWTPLFAVAGAIVTETGGVLSHAAVTAREYGLPAVLSVTNATRLIRDGQAIEVDGSAGIVRILT